MSTRPNIVYILNDHQAWYRHGWDGGPRVQRPQFERLARSGVEFSRAYTACPLCGPARRTMLTGLFPHNHGEVKNDSNHPFDREVYLDLLGADEEIAYVEDAGRQGGRASEPGQIERDDVAFALEQSEDRLPHLPLTPGAMDQHERLAGTTTVVMECHRRRLVDRPAPAMPALQFVQPPRGDSVPALVADRTVAR